VKACERGGIKYDDLDHVPLAFVDQLIAFRNGSIDATIALEPWGTLAGREGYAVRVAGSDVFYPNEQITTVIYGNVFVERKPDLARRFMVAYLRAARYYRDALRNGHLAGPTANDVISILTGTTKLDPSLLREMYVPSVDPNGKLNVDSLLQDYAIYKQAGLLTGEVAMHQVIDTSWVEAAAKTVGPYHPAR
jgi:NitT/TauT family transport system substrate-binding protein